MRRDLNSEQLREASNEEEEEEVAKGTGTSLSWGEMKLIRLATAYVESPLLTWAINKPRRWLQFSLPRCSSANRCPASILLESRVEMRSGGCGGGEEFLARVDRWAKKKDDARETPRVPMASRADRVRRSSTSRLCDGRARGAAG
jgi:hypothetical protein